MTVSAASMHCVSVSCAAGRSLGRPIQKKYSWSRLGVPRSTSIYAPATAPSTFDLLILIRAMPKPSTEPSITTTADIHSVPYRPEIKTLLYFIHILIILSIASALISYSRISYRSISPNTNHASYIPCTVLYSVILRTACLAVLSSCVIYYSIPSDFAYSV